MSCPKVRNGVIIITEKMDTATIEISTIKLDTTTKHRITSQVINGNARRGMQNYPPTGIISFHSCKIQ